MAKKVAKRPTRAKKLRPTVTSYYTEDNTIICADLDDAKAFAKTVIENCDSIEEFAEIRFDTDKMTDAELRQTPEWS